MRYIPVGCTFETTTATTSEIISFHFCNCIYLCIGVASYGELGHVLPRLPIIFFFCFILELYKLWQQSLISNICRILFTTVMKINPRFILLIK